MNIPTLREALISNGTYSESEVDEAIASMKEEVLAGADPEEILYEVGLEPDYIFDLLD